MSTVRPVHPRFLLLLFLTAFFGVLAAGWGGAGLSDQELLANYAKAMDYADGFKRAGGWPWWTPFFNSGQSQAPALGTLFAYLPLILSSPLGPWTGAKAAALIFGAAGGLAMFAFAKALTRSEWTALGCAVLYVLCPQFALRAAWNEHLVVLFCFPYPPLICWALLRLRQQPSTGASLALAAATAAMFLTYAKIAAVFLPAAFLFALWLGGRDRGTAGRFCKGILKAIGFFLLLGAIPLLPTFRERGGLALFEFDPLREWQYSFSVHTPLSLLDRAGILLRGLPPGLALDHAGTYVGIVTIGALAWILFRRRDWCRGAGAGPLRIFLAMALLLFWFSLGPQCLLLAHWKLLGHAQKMSDWVLPVLWLAMILPGLLMAMFWPWSRKGIGLVFLVVGIAGFYLLPGFWIFEQITQIRDIRAPWSFWQVGGSFAAAMVGGLCLPPVFAALKTGREKAGLGIVLTALALLDAAPYEKEFFKPGLEPGTAGDFHAAQEFLASAPVPGWILPVSGRYFYLMIPEMSGRGLVMEAFQSYLMPRPTKLLLDATSGSTDLLRAYLKTAGVAYVLLDKHDPDIGKDAGSFFQDLLPTAFENEHFMVLQNSESLAPAFFAGQVILFPPQDGFEEEILSKAGMRNFLAVPSLSEGKGLPGIAGRVIQTGEAVAAKAEFQMEEGFRNTKGIPFLRVPPGEVQRSGPHHIGLQTTAPQPGWITVPESFHRDWKAEVNGQPVEIFRGMGAFLSVPVGVGAQQIDLFFHPPFWYSLCAWSSSAAWTLAVLVLGAAAFLRPLREKWFGGELPGNDFSDPEVVASGGTAWKKNAIGKALVVVPCYNEAVSIAETLGQILQHSLVEVLVVDDASPDGTAGIVEGLPEFGSRIHLLKRAGKLGLASAYKEGFAWALQRNFDAVLEIDADLSHDPDDIGRLIAALDEGADLAVGSRYLGGVRVLNWPQHRLFLSLFAGVYTRFFTGLPMSDPTSGFKAIRREVLEAMDWKGFEAEGYGFQIELHLRAWRRNFVLKEVPIVFTERRAGASKMSRQIAWEAAGRVLRLAFEKDGGGKK